VQLSSNLYDYSLVTCATDTNPLSNASCTLNAPSTATLFADVLAGSDDRRSVVSYLEGVLAYAVFGIAAAVLSLLYAIAYCFGRSCCCCIKGGCCGKAHPTYAVKSCRLGFTEVEAPLLSRGGRQELAYPTRARWCCRGWMFVYIAAVLLFISLGHSRGNEGLTRSMKAVVAAPTNLMNTVRSVQTPLNNIIINPPPMPSCHCCRG